MECSRYVVHSTLAGTPVKGFCAFLCVVLSAKPFITQQTTHWPQLKRHQRKMPEQKESKGLNEQNK